MIRAGGMACGKSGRPGLPPVGYGWCCSLLESSEKWVRDGGLRGGNEKGVADIHKSAVYISGILQATAGLLSLMILVLGMGVSGCTSAHRVETVEERAVRDEAGLKAFEEGVQAFQRKDYGKAVAFFEALSEEATDDRVARSALYGLAVAKLTVASTPEEFRNALNLWECWKRQVPEGVSGEDPRMLTPFLESVTPPGVSGEPVPKVEKPPKPSINPGVAIYRSLLESKDKELDRVKAKLDNREREVRRLKQQIDSLEKIHIKYQEKKQGVSSP